MSTSPILKTKNTTNMNAIPIQGQTAALVREISEQAIERFSRAKNKLHKNSPDRGDYNKKITRLKELIAAIDIKIKHHEII